MLTRERRAPARGGFTLMELLVVVAIIVVLAGAAVPMYMKYLEDAKLDRAWQDAVTIAQQAEAYRLQHNGDPPGTLQELTRVDDNGHAVFEPRNLIDPWGREYQYAPQGGHSNTGKVEVWSTGPRGNTQIGNWMSSAREGK
jgi:general secretion pathway protein G